MDISRKRGRWYSVFGICGFALLLICVVRVGFWYVENDIRESAYRYAFANLYHNRSAWHASYISVCYGCSSPDDRNITVLTTPFLLNHFKGCNPPVKSVSECQFDDGLNRIADKKTRQPGVIFYTGKVKWISRDMVEIEVGYYEGMLSASGNIYTLKKKNGRWVVVNDKMNYIS